MSEKRGPLLQKHFRVAEYERRVYQAYPEFGTAFEDVLKPEYWAHVAAKIKPWSEVILHPEDETYWAHLLVTKVSMASCVVKVLAHAVLTSEEVGEADDEFEIKWSGPMKRFRVIRKSDGAILAEGDEVHDREKAEAWLRNHKQALAA